MVAIAITTYGNNGDAAGDSGEEPGHAGGAADAGVGSGCGRRGPEDHGGDLRHGPVDAQGPGASLLRGRVGRALEPPGFARGGSIRRVHPSGLCSFALVLRGCGHRMGRTSAAGCCPGDAAAARRPLQVIWPLLSASDLGSGNQGG